MADLLEEGLPWQHAAAFLRTTAKRITGEKSSIGELMCNAYEDRLEEIRMALTLDRPKKNPYEPKTIEHSIWELRETVKRLSKYHKNHP